MNTSTRTRVLSSPRAVFLFPVAVALVCILPSLGHRQLWFDEHATWWASTLSFADLGRLTHNLDAIRIPYYSFMHVWIAVAGASAAAMRLPEALAMACSAGLVALIGRRLFSERIGLVAGLLFALVPTVTRYGQESRPYAFAMCFSLLATLSLLHALDKPSRRVWTGYALAIALTGFSHTVALCVVAAHALAVLRARRDGDRIAHWAFPFAVAMGVSAVVPMVFTALGQSHRIRWNIVTARGLSQYGPDLFGSCVMFGGLLSLAIAGCWAAGRHSALLTTWAVLPPVLTGLTGELLNLFRPGYLLFTIPAWTLLAAVGAIRCWDVITAAGGKSRRWRVLGAVLMTGASAVFLLQIVPALAKAHRDPWGEPDYAGAARVVKAGQRPGDGIVFHHALRSRLGMSYELRNGARPKDVLMKQPPQQTGGFAAHEYKFPGNHLTGAARLWLISPLDGGAHASVPTERERALKRGYRVVRTQRLHHVTVQLLERRSR